ncbi:flagellar protein export ATPase FliI [Thiolapillus brandeum]|uniref:Flagellum-specific ATP synthase n=1 Tax=Thiolapillus brandeum TaxID=1076588 RepID=A0A7U6GIM4_9GAMM|nr:flagellar protein export ATPase FliI [Thiolapillus brandeum]BAO44309.1 flagellum-specific ATP synthase [Thiolapillus brandeum]
MNTPNNECRAAIGTQWETNLRKYREHASNAATMVVEGRVKRIVGLTIEAVGIHAPIGARCRIHTDNTAVESEVVGFAGSSTYLMPAGDSRGLMPNARVVPGESSYDARVGDGLLGRVVDASGNPLDGRGPINYSRRRALLGHPVNPLKRWPIDTPLDVGVRSINAMLTVGRGQRIGLFAGSGVGKSVLLGMMTKYTNADVVVVGLIGERGREVKEFVENILGESGRKKAVVVASPADNPPLLRMHGAWLATSIAEYYRDQGKHVLLLMDSLTRFAQAQREIALAIGEPPATKGYPPSAFARLPQLVERAGNGEQGGGSITAFYTVLAEGDDQNDPVVDSARAILDGHVVLSRELAEGGHYPAIDIEASVSRVMGDIVPEEHIQAARRFRQLYSTYHKNQDLISVGAYKSGSDPRVDEAIQYYPRLVHFLQQNRTEAEAFEQSIRKLLAVIGPDQSKEEHETE